MNGPVQVIVALAGIKYLVSSNPKSPQPDEFEKLDQHINAVIASGRRRGRAAIEAEDRRERERERERMRHPRTPNTPNWSLAAWYPPAMRQFGWHCAIALCAIGLLIGWLVYIFRSNPSLLPALIE